VDSAAALLLMLAAATITAIVIVRVVRARPQLARREDRRILAEHIVDMVSTHEADGTFRFVSPVLAGMVGEYPGTMVGRQPSEFAHPDDAQALAGLWRRVTQLSGTAQSLTWRCRRHDGEHAWLETTARASSADARDIGAVVCGHRDVTERKQIEDALRESEQRFRTTLETVRLVAVGLDPMGRVTFCNDALLLLTGYRRADLIGENWFDKVVASGELTRTSYFEAIGSGIAPTKYENEIICADGRRRTIEWDTTLLRAPSGDIGGTASLGADVTERRQEETALKLLQSITLSISTSTNLTEALERTLESLCIATGWGYAEVWMTDDEDSHIERVSDFASPGLDVAALVAAGAKARFARGEGLPGRAWANKSVDWFPDLVRVSAEKFPRLAIAAQSGFRSAVAVPVLADDKVVAVLVFFIARPRPSDQQHTQVVTIIANQVGAVIERRHAQAQYEQEILRARDAAQAANRAKSDFLSRMSHELRTPLNSVIGFANVLRKNKGGRLSPDDLLFLDRIASNGHHLLTLVNNVLDIAKVEAGRLTVTTGLVNVDQLLHDIVGQLDGQPREAGVTLSAKAPEDVVPIESDSVLLKQVLINLTGNALRFTREGSVVLSLDADAKTGQPLRIHVTDTGIGIPRERQAAIFEPFEQADAMTHRTYGGTGLGLSISKAICDALGYRLTVESEPGRGSRFTVHLQ
jgi:two-component system sensor histidine kinase/response regulator